MATDEEKYKLTKLLQGLDVPELKLPERCNELIKEFYEKYDSAMDDEDLVFERYENPYVPDRILIKENEKKLKELLAESKRKKITRSDDTNLNADPKRPWRTNSSREKLLRVDIELKQHRERAIQAVTPLEEDQMKDLVKECQEETLVSRPIGADRLRETVEEARKNLPNFLYRNVENSTATAIMQNAHLNN
ncbi:uncharacterized protein LOC126780795 isoform X3 [Nymphalis io]|uniref:uncharacterized protein LOC126780795 isoform X3 n=1 Tax=Inachis io TaxID=171585 RepID=UPI0021675C9D|nr:uncharacterized protein LOC126780795 isoform X3 [Nymphalis io]